MLKDRHCAHIVTIGRKQEVFSSFSGLGQMCMSPRHNDAMETGQTPDHSAKENQTPVPLVDKGTRLSTEGIMIQENIFLSGRIFGMIPSMNIKGRSHDNEIQGIRKNRT